MFIKKLVMLALGICFLLTACTESKGSLKEKSIIIQSVGNPNNKNNDWITLVLESYLRDVIHHFEPTASINDVSILHYYGTYNGSIVVMLNSVYLQYTEALRTEVIGGATFYFNNGNRILVFNNGIIYELSEAFNKGLLTKENLMQINNCQKEYYPFLY